MNIFIKALLLLSLPVVLVGCTHETNNTNASVDTNSTVNTSEATNTNQENPINTNGNQGIVNKENNQNTDSTETNTNDTSNSDEPNPESGIDTSDWLTYENEKFGFRFQHPKEWSIQMNDADVIIVSTNQAGLRGSIVVREGIRVEGMSVEDALTFEDGREPLPLISDEITEINNLPTYRAVRQIKEGSLLYPDSGNNEKVQETRTEPEYTYLNHSDIFRFWFTIDGDFESLVPLVDEIARSFIVTNQ